MNNLCYKPNDTTIIYGSGNYFLRSNDGGANFTAIADGLPSGSPRIETAVTSANSNYVYIVVAASDETFGGLYKSTDSGLHFTTQSTSPNILGYSDDGNDYAGQAWYDLAIAVSPSNENEVFVGGINVWKSTDGGINWTPSSNWYWGSGYGYTHADIHSLDFYNNRLYCGSDGGVFYSDDLGQNWNNLSSGLGITEFYRIAGSDAYPDLLLAGAQDNGCNKYLNNFWTHIYGADGMECAIDYSDTNTLYISTQGGAIQKSTDGGNNFTDISVYDYGNWTTPYLIHPSNHEMIFAGYSDVYKSIDGGFNWNPMNISNSNGTINQMAVSPSDPNYVYVSKSSKLYYTHDGGANWNLNFLSSSNYITGITVDETNPQKLWICTSSSSSDNVFVSIDGGNNFSNITGNLTNVGFNCIIHQKGSNNGLYLGFIPTAFLEIGFHLTQTSLMLL